jgi:hypothetical protein
MPRAPAQDGAPGHPRTAGTVSWSSALTRSLAWPRGAGHTKIARRVQQRLHRHRSGQNGWPATRRGPTRRPRAVRAPRAAGTASLGSPQATMQSPPWSAPPTPAKHAPQRASRATSQPADPPTAREPAPPQARHEFAQAPTPAQTQPAPRRYAASNAPPPSSCPDPRSTSETQPRAAQDPQSSRSDAAATGPTDPAATHPALTRGGPMNGLQSPRLEATGTHAGTRPPRSEKETVRGAPQSQPQSDQNGVSRMPGATGWRRRLRDPLRPRLDTP